MVAKPVLEKPRRQILVNPRRSKFKSISKAKNYPLAVPLNLKSTQHRNLCAVIGASRCGTKYFWEIAKRHPRLRQSDERELWYFGFDAPRRPHKKYTELFERGPGILFESTPTYLQNHRAIKELAQAYPAAKLVLLLRNPIERCISYWYRGQENRSGKNSLAASGISFEKHVEDQLNELADKGPPICGSVNGTVTGSAVITGLYAVYLKWWLEDFYPDQFIVYYSEEFFAQPRATIVDLYSKLSIPHEVPMGWLGKAHKNAAKRSKISKTLRQQLLEVFLPYNLELEALLSRKVPRSWMAV